MAVDPPRVTPEPTLLSRVAYRGREVTGPGRVGCWPYSPATCGAAAAPPGWWRALAGGAARAPGQGAAGIVSRTRAQLGANVIASTPNGYRLSPAQDQVDVSAVLLCAAAAARHAQAGDHAAALAEAEAGLALWDAAPDGAA